MSETHSLHSSSMHKPSASPTNSILFVVWTWESRKLLFNKPQMSLLPCSSVTDQNLPFEQTMPFPYNDWQIRCHSKIIPPGTIILVMPILIVWYRYPCIIFYWFTRIYLHCSSCCCSSCSMIDKRVLKRPKVSGTLEGVYWRHMNLSMVKCE